MFNETEFDRMKSYCDRMLARKRLLTERIEDLNLKLAATDSRIQNSLNAQAIIQEVAMDTQSNLEYHISNLVTTALHSVFPDDIEFVAKIELRAGKTACKLMFKEYDSEYKPLEGSGFGPVDVASFALRISFWALNKNRHTFILDEPFRNVSPDLQEKVSHMLKMLSKNLGIQIIMVSHQEDVNIAADKTFLTTKEGKFTKMKEIS